MGILYHGLMKNAMGIKINYKFVDEFDTDTPLCGYTSPPAYRRSLPSRGSLMVSTLLAFPLGGRCHAVTDEG